VRLQREPALGGNRALPPFDLGIDELLWRDNLDERRATNKMRGSVAALG